MNGEMIQGMPYEMYDQIDAMRFHHLNELKSSGARYQWVIKHPPGDRDAFKIGNATDIAILTPDKFVDEVACAPDVKRTTTEGKALYAKFTAENEGKIVLKSDDYQQCLLMAHGVSESNTASTLISQAKTQVTIIWTDPETEVKCKARLDGLIEPLKTAFDLKTTRDLPSFAYSIAKFGYAGQAAWYMEALKNVGVNVEHFLFIVVDKNPPYHVQTFRLLDEVIELGRKSNRELLLRYVQYKRAKKWPGLVDSVIDIGLTEWQKSQAFNIA